MKKIQVNYLFILTLFVLFSGAVYGAQVWTTDSNGQLKIDFDPGDEVHVHGSEFEPSTPIDITITRTELKTPKFILPYLSSPPCYSPPSSGLS